MKLRRRVYQLLENEDPRNPWGHRVQLLLIALIMINVFCVVLESEPEFNERFASLFDFIETVSVLIFTAEYIIRVWSSVEANEWRRHHSLKARMRYMMTPMALVDLAAILPFWLQFFTGIDLRILRALRLLRVFKLTRYAPVVRLFLDVLREEAESIGAALLLLLVLMMVSSSLMYLAEHEVQPDKFATIPSTMWWAVVTLTTVGYGDVVPVTGMGKFIAGVATILGVGMVALPTGILLAGLQDQIHRRRERFRKRVDKLISGGPLSTDQMIRLEQIRERLGIDEEEAQEILARELAEEREDTCPHCGKSLSGKPEG